MKKFVFILCLAFFANTAFSQYSEMTEKQLKLSLEQAIKLKNTGTALTIVGGLTFIGSLVLYSSGLSQMVDYNTDSEYDAGATKALVGAAGILVGGGLAGVGIPLWIVGANKRDKILIYLAKFDEQSYVRSVGIQIHF